MKALSNYCRIIKANLDIGDLKSAENMALMTMESLQNSRQAAYYLNFISKYPEIPLNRNLLFEKLSNYHKGASSKDLCLIANAGYKFDNFDEKFTNYFINFLNNNIRNLTIVDACQSLFYLSKIKNTKLYLKILKSLANRQLSAHAITSIITSSKQLNIDVTNYEFLFKKIPIVLQTFTPRQASTVLGYGTKYINTNLLLQLSDIIIKSKDSSPRDLVVALNSLVTRSNNSISILLQSIYLKLNNMDMSLLDAIGILNGSSKISDNLPQESFDCCKKACQIISNNVFDCGIEEISHLPFALSKLKWLNTCKLLSQINRFMLNQLDNGDRIIPHLFTYLRGLSLIYHTKPLQLDSLHKFMQVFLDKLKNIPIKDYTFTISSASILFPNLKSDNIDLLKGNIITNIEYLTLKDYALILKSLQRWKILDDNLLKMFTERIMNQLNSFMKESSNVIVTPSIITNLSKIFIENNNQDGLLEQIICRYVNKYSQQFTEKQMEIINNYLNRKIP